MQNKIREKSGAKKREVVGQDIQPRPSKFGESKIVKEEERKIEVEIREVVRIYPRDFAALKNSFEEWSAKWD